MNGEAKRIPEVSRRWRRLGRTLVAAGMVFAVSLPADAQRSIQRIDVYRFNDALEHGRPQMWEVPEGAILAPVYVLAGSGDILAMVRPYGERKLILKRWTIEGKLVNSRVLDVAEDVAASSLDVDARLTLVSGSELLQLSGSLADAPVRVPLPEGVKGSKRVVAGPGAAWFQFDDRLVRLGLDGNTVVVKLPLYKVAANFAGCFEGQNQRFPCEYVNGRERLLFATSDGGCYVKEPVTHEYRVSGSHKPDRPGTYALSSLGPNGQLRAQVLRGEVTTKWEWFWSRKSPSNPTIFPEDWGIVRTRYRSTEGFVNLAERSNGDVLIFTAAPDAICRLDRSLKPRWKESIDDLYVDGVVSPPWTRGVLMTVAGRLLVVNEDGSGEREAYYGDDDAMKREDFAPIRVAVGQIRNGEWLIVNY